MVRRILEKHLQPTGTDRGPSWLTVLGHTKDSLWSIDLFRIEHESIALTHRLLVVMDLNSRRMIGFAVQAIAVDGPALCRIIDQAQAGNKTPKRLSFDHDPLFDFLQWRANLRVLEMDGVRSVPPMPVSPPFADDILAPSDASTWIISSTGMDAIFSKNLTPPKSTSTGCAFALAWQAEHRIIEPAGLNLKW